MRPERLKRARLQKQNGEISAEQLRLIENEEIIRLVKKQKEVGLTGCNGWGIKTSMVAL